MRFMALVLAGALVCAGCSAPPVISAPAPATVSPVAGSAGAATPPPPLPARSLAPHRAGSGRFRSTLEIGRVEVDAESTPGPGFVTIAATGSFDRADDAIELRVDLSELAASLPRESGVDAAGSGGVLEVRVIGATAYLAASVEAAGTPEEARWVAVPLGEAGVFELVGVSAPDDLLSLLRHVGTLETSDDGGELDGVATIHHSGWLSARALGAANGLEVSRLALLVERLPEGALERLWRFDVWIGEDELPRRLVVQLDSAALAAVADRLDGSGDAVRSLVLRHRVDWYELGSEIEIPVPACELHFETDPAYRPDPWGPQSSLARSQRPSTSSGTAGPC